MSKNYYADTPKLELADSQIELELLALGEQRSLLQEDIRKRLPGRDETRETYMYHVMEASNAYAYGDKARWLAQRSLKQEIQAEHDNPIKEAKNNLARVIEKINPLEDELLRRSGKFFIFEGDVLGNASKTVSFPSNTPQWHAQRAEGIGGSDIASIMGVSPWGNRKEIFLLKTGQEQGKSNPWAADALWRGNIWEDAIARMYYANHEDDTVFVNCKDSWKSNTRSYQLSNVDGLVYGFGEESPSKVVEIKTSSTPESWKDGVPNYYRLQVLWYMDSFGIEKSDFAVNIDDVDYREFEVIPEPGEIEAMHEEVSRFVDEVVEWKKNH